MQLTGMRGLLGTMVTLAIGVAPLANAAAAAFTIYDEHRTIPILMDASYGGPHNDRSYRQVRRAVQDLRQDIAMVTGAIEARDVQAQFTIDAEKQQERLKGADQSKVPALLTAAKGEPTAIIIGVIGQSALIDSIIVAGKFDEAKEITGKWEAYAMFASFLSLRHRT